MVPLRGLVTTLRSLDIDELVLLVFWRMDSRMVGYILRPDMSGQAVFIPPYGTPCACGECRRENYSMYSTNP
jgi:hypothetical protein